MFECSILALALVQANDVRGEEIFPETSFLMAEVEDVEGLLKRMSKEGPWAAIPERIEDMRRSMFEELSQDYDVTEDDIVMPGQIGVCAYVSFDEDLGMEVPAYMAYADFGTHEKMAGVIFEMTLDTLDEQGQVDFDEDEMRGRPMIIFESSMEMPDIGEAMGDVGMMMPIGGGLDGMMEPLSTVYLIRDGGRLLLGSDPVGLDDALGVIDGGRAKVLADNRDYKALREMIPPQGREMYAMLLTENLQPMVGPLLAGPMAAGVVPMIQELFGDVRGYGFWADAGRGDNLVEYGVAVQIDGDRRGLMKLLDLSRPAGEIPAYVPAEAVSYGRLDFDFKNLIPTMRQVIAGLPEAQAQQVAPMFEQFAPILQSGLETLGPEVHVFTVPTDSPFSPSRTTVCIPSSNAESLEQMFAMMAPAAGLMPRDFNGSTIYSDPLDEFSRTAIGIGAGSLILGESDGVEAVLRSVGQKGLPSMDRSDIARSVQRGLPSGGLMGWGVVDIVKQMQVQQGAIAMMPMLMEQAGLDAQDMRDQLNDMPNDEAAMDELRKAMGPGWWYMKSDTPGFMFRGGIANPSN